jgi:hypothetical protein
VAFALPNVCYQVRLPAIWIGVSLMCCICVTFSIYRSETYSFFILHQKTLSVLSIIYAPVILDLMYTFIGVSASLQWLLMDITLQMVEFALLVYFGQVMVTFNFLAPRILHLNFSTSCM